MQWFFKGETKLSQAKQNIQIFVSFFFFKWTFKKLKYKFCSNIIFAKIQCLM